MHRRERDAWLFDVSKPMTTLFSQSILKVYGLRIALAFAVAAGLVWLLIQAPETANTSAASSAADLPSSAAIQVTGSVRDVVGTLLAGATICARGESTVAQLDRYCATSDANGDYSLMLMPGDYSVVASAINHASQSLSLTAEESRLARLDFILERQTPTLAGIIKSAAGDRIHAARIDVYQGPTLVANVTTNNKGEFSAWTPPGSLTLNVNAEGFGAAVVQTVAPTMDISVILYPGNVVSGQVLMQDSLQPVANVHVTAMSRRDRVVEQLRDAAVRTDEHGQFTFTNLPAGAWLLTVADAGLWGTVSEPIVVSSGKDEHDITLLVQPAGKVSGRFLVGTEEQPCPVGRLHLTPEALARAAETKSMTNPVDRPTVEQSKAPSVFTALVKEDGTVQFDAVPYGIYRLGPICKEHQLLSGPPVSLDINGPTTAELKWRFAPGLGLGVRVIDEAGRPIAGALVALALQSESPLPESQTIHSQRNGITDMEGRYRFGGLQTGTYQVKARYAAVIGKAVATESVDLQAGGETTALTMTLPGRGAMRIHAHTPDNAPLSRILFFAMDSDGARYEGAYQGDGRFVIGPLPYGDYRVYGYDNKNAKLPLNGGNYVSISRTDAVDLDFSYSTPGARLEGRVTDSTGAPMPGVFIRAVSSSLGEEDEHYSYLQTTAHGGQELMTNQSGSFRIEGLTHQAAYDLYVDHPSGLKEVRRQVTPGQFLEIAFPKSASVVGTVVDDKGTPINRFDVLVVYEGTNENRSQSFNTANGQFKMDNVRPGRALIAIYGNEGDRSAERSVTLVEGGTFSAGQFVLGTAPAT